MQKKIIYIVISIVLVLAGFFSGRSSTSRDITKLESSVAELTSENKRIGGELEESTNQAGKLASELQTARNTIERLNGELFAITDQFSNIGSGLSEADSGLQGVIEGIDYYIEKAETEK